jgi:C1A family cysteine protease
MIKSVVDLRSSFGMARDQDPRPTCLAFAASDAHAAARAGWQPLSAEWAYYYSLKRDGGLPDEGATLSAMLETLRSDGQPIESRWPYIKAHITDISAWTPPAGAVKLFFRDHGACAATVTHLTDQLNAGVPVLITMTISDAFYRPSADGIIEANEPIDAKRRHAVVAVGHGERGATRLVLIRNSWGEAWGLKGHAWIGVDYLSPRLTEAAIMTAEL